MPPPVARRSEGLFLSFAHLTSSGHFAPLSLAGRVLYLTYAFAVGLVLACYIGADAPVARVICRRSVPSSIHARRRKESFCL